MNDEKRVLLFAGIVVGGLALMGGGAMVYSNYKQRGIRNNNPGNIDYNPKTNWVGQLGSDGRFIKFDKPESGIRALYRTLMTYRNTHKLTTIAGIINRWAPPVENNTTSYVNAVSKAVGKAANAPLDLADYPALIKAIIKHENGVQPYPDATIIAGILLA